MQYKYKFYTIGGISMVKKWFLSMAVLLTFVANSFITSYAAVRGDLNNDNRVDSLDYAFYKMYLLGSYHLSDISVADLNGDGDTNSIDYAILKQYLLGMIKEFPADANPTPTPSSDPKKDWENNKGTINLGSTITYTGEGISVNGSTVMITSGGDHTVTGTLTNGMIYINTKERVKLRLSGVNITNSSGPAIFFEDVDKGFITIVEGTVNYLTDGRNYNVDAKATLFSNDDLEIKGKGTLNITANYNHAIASDDDINIENGTINIISAANDGIHANGSIDITGGTLNITATGDCLQTEEEELRIEDGKLTLSAGSQALKSDIGVVISGGTVNVVKAKEGIEAPNITINGGTINIESEDDCINASMSVDAMFNSDGSQLIINGGTIYASATIGDAVDSNGDFTMNGGTLVVHGPQSQPEVAIDVNGNFTVKGGTLIAVGPSPLMAQYPTGASSQYSIAAMFNSTQPANSALCIKDSTGKVLAITRPKRNYIYVVFSSPELRQGSTYTIYSGGNVSGGTEQNGLIVGGTYNGGTELATITVTNSPTTAVNWNSGFFPGGGFPGGGFPGGGFPGGGGGFPGWGW